LVKVCFGLVMTTEGLFDHINLRKPFDGSHGVPPGNNDPQRIAMHDRERLSVHRVGKQHIRRLSVLDGQATLEANRFVACIKFAAVSAPKHYFTRTRFNTCTVENLSEWHARPFGRAYGS